MTAQYNQVVRWTKEKPVFHTSFDEDQIILRDFITAGESLFQQLPLKRVRDEPQSQLAMQILQTNRETRYIFLERYVTDVYSTLTNNFNCYHRLKDLVLMAAKQFPGLVPSQDKLQLEDQCIQADKEGLEIDLGLFFHMLLRDERIARHLADSMLRPCPLAIDLMQKLIHTQELNIGSVLYQRREHVAYLTINNPNCLNAEDNQFTNDMETAIDLALLDDQIKVGVIRGGKMTHPRYFNQRVFCSGLNLTALYHGKIPFIDFFLTRELGYLSKMKHGLLSCDASMSIENRIIQKPWIAVVDTFAIGGGMQLLLACDKVIADKKAYFSLPAAQEGIIPGAANFRLPRMIGQRLARQMILSGHKIFATDPEAQLFCDDILDAALIEKTLEDSVKVFSQPAVIDNRKMLSLAEEPRDLFLKYMAEFSLVQAQRLHSPDVLMNIEHWIKKKKPKE